MTRWKHFPLGLRTLKTGIAVTLAVLLVRLFVTDELSVFYAAFGALIAMERTFSGSLKQALSQLIGVVAGTVLGSVMLLLFPQATPAWAAGIGVVLLLLLLCNVLKLNFVASFSCIIFLSASLTPTGNVLRDSLFRLRDTAAGIAVALVVNAVIVPYNNKARIRSLLTQLRAQIPQQVESIVIFERFPDLRPNVELLRRIDHELQLYHNQRFSTGGTTKRPRCAAAASSPDEWSRSWRPSAAWTRWAIFRPKMPKRCVTSAWPSRKPASPGASVRATTPSS